MPFKVTLGRLLSKTAYKIDFFWDKRILYKRFLLYSDPLSLCPQNLYTVCPQILGVTLALPLCGSPQNILAGLAESTYSYQRDE